MAYDASRIANFGRDTSRAYTSFLRRDEILCSEINVAIHEGITPRKIAHDIMGRCPDHEGRVNLMSVLIASARMGKIPESVVEPYEEGIRPKRI